MTQVQRKRPSVLLAPSEMCLELLMQDIFCMCFAVQRVGVLRQHIWLRGVRLQEHKLQRSDGRCSLKALRPLQPGLLPANRHHRQQLPLVSSSLF